MKIFHRCLRGTRPEGAFLVGGRSTRSQGPLTATPNERGVIMTSLQQKHILLVEDDVDTLSATTAMLERLGYSVRAETEGLKALRTFSEAPNRFDLALLDHGMADVTGLELAWHMRRIRPGFPVVIYTGYFDTLTAEQLDAAGIAGRVILKPATLTELTDALREALHEGAGSETEP